MPIRPENKSRYPKDWRDISRRIRERADNRCEECGVENYALGGRDRTGRFLLAHPTGDNGMHLTWPQPGTFAWCGPREGDSPGEYLRIIRIVLTTAHLDHTPENCADGNLRSLCQRCHNRYDAAMRRAGIKVRAKEKMAAGDLLETVTP